MVFKKGVDNKYALWVCEGVYKGSVCRQPVLQILSYVAQVERENIHQRQMEGIRVARQRGVVFGRSKIEVPDDFYAVATRWQCGQVNLREGAEMLSVSHTTFSKWLHARKIEKNL